MIDPDNIAESEHSFVNELERQFAVPILAVLSEGDMLVALKVTVILGMIFNAIEDYLEQNSPQEADLPEISSVGTPGLEVLTWRGKTYVESQGRDFLN